MARNPNEFSVNQRVNHHVYGLGTISMIDDLHMIIDFDENGRKKFIASMIRLEHSDAAPPARAKTRARKAKTSK